MFYPESEKGLGASVGKRSPSQVSPLEGTWLPASVVTKLYWGSFLLTLFGPAADQTGVPGKAVVLPGSLRRCTAGGESSSLPGFQQPALAVPCSVGELAS